MRNDRERDSKAAVLREVFAEATNFFDERKESVLLPVRHAHEKEREIYGRTVRSSPYDMD